VEVINKPPLLAVNEIGKKEVGSTQRGKKLKICRKESTPDTDNRYRVVYFLRTQGSEGPRARESTVHENENESWETRVRVYCGHKNGYDGMEYLRDKICGC